jgi:hypothetical protein
MNNDTNTECAWLVVYWDGPTTVTRVFLDEERARIVHALHRPDGCNLYKSPTTFLMVVDDREAGPPGPHEW